MSAQPAATAGSTATQEQVDWFRQTFDRLVGEHRAAPSSARTT